MIEFSNIKNNEIKKQIEFLAKKIKLAPTKRVMNQKERYFSTKSHDELEKILKEFDLDEFIPNIDYLIKCESMTFGLSNKAINKSTNKNELNEMKNYYLMVLERIERVAKRYSNLLKFFDELSNFVMSTFKYNQRNIDKLIETLNITNLSINEKEYYIDKIKQINEEKINDVKNIVERIEQSFKRRSISDNEKGIVEIFEQKLEQSQKKRKTTSMNANIQNYLNRYFLPDSDFFLGDNYVIFFQIGDCGGGENINSIIRVIEQEGLNVETFAYLVTSILDEMKKNNKKDYTILLDTIHDAFLSYFEYRKKIREIKLFIDSISKSDLNNFFETMNEIRMLYNELETAFSNFNTLEQDVISTLINKINKEITKFKLLQFSSYQDNESINSFGVKGLVLFDSNAKNEVYVESDLMGNSPFIEDKAKKLCPDYAKQFSSLIMNFQKKASEYIADNVSNETNREKICTEISFKESNGSVNHQKGTGIYRVRPQQNSQVRVAERKISIKSGKKIHKQILEILTKYYPQFTYDENEDLTIFAVCGAAVKCADTTLYDQVANKRKFDLSVVKLFAKDGDYINLKGRIDFEVKEELSNDELLLFEEFIKNTISTMDKLQKNNSDYDFTFFKKEESNQKCKNITIDN